MSGSAFEGLVGLAQPQAESYTPSGSAVDPGFLARIGQVYADVEREQDRMAWYGHRGAFDILSERLRPVLAEAGRIDDIPSLLREAAGAVRWLVGDRPLIRDDLVVSPLIQALYSLGHNEFTVDLGKILGGDAPDYSIRYVAGTEERPLRISCMGDAGCVANRIAHCDLRYTGDTESLGTSAKDSRIVAKGRVGDAGMCADRTEFHLASAESLTTRALVFGEGCTYYVDNPDITRDQATSLWLSTFWYTRADKETPLISVEPLRRLAHKLGVLACKNHLYIPRDGKWAEAVP